MKFLIKFPGSQTDLIRTTFVAENSFTSVKDLVTSNDGVKFATIDTSAKTISFFNKISEDKIRAIKIDSAAVSEISETLTTILKFDSSEVLAQGSEILVYSDDTKGQPKKTIPMDLWYKFKLGATKKYIFFTPMKDLKEFPESKLLGGKSALAILEMNYAFCDEESSSNRDMFASIEVYSCPVLEDFLFASVDTLIGEFAENNYASAIYEEITNPKYNKVLKKLRGEEDEIVFIGLKSKKDNFVWVPRDIILQYMDMNLDIFDTCLGQLKGLKKELSYELPEMSNFETTKVENLKISLVKSDILIKFANILEMKEPFFDVQKQKFVNLEEYDLTTKD